MSVKEKIEDIKRRISRSAEKSGRNPSDIKLVCVTKNIPPQKIKEAIQNGITDIGESRVQEAREKYTGLKNHNLTWHLIGHLQTNKSKKAVEMFNLIQSLDSMRLAIEINKHSQEANKTQDCLLEVRVSEEESKYGFHPDDLGGVIKQVSKLSSIRILGIMTMAPFFDDPELARPYFRRAKENHEKFYSFFPSPNPYSSSPILSMGMSNDFEVAVEEGSNMVRLGTAIFS